MAGNNYARIIVRIDIFRTLVYNSLQHGSVRPLSFSMRMGRGERAKTGPGRVKVGNRESGTRMFVFVYIFIEKEMPQ